jgi:hypothetical protein
MLQLHKLAIHHCSRSGVDLLQHPSVADHLMLLLGLRRDLPGWGDGGGGGGGEREVATKT